MFDARKENPSTIPWLTYDAINYLNSLITKDMDIFEYGCGNSTIFYAQRCKSVVAVEHHLKWSDLLKEKSKNLPCEIIYMEIPKNKKDRKAKHKEAYSAVINNYGSFDMIIVDGLFRNDCIAKALYKIKPGGHIIVDNSDRNYSGQTLLDKYEKLEFFGAGPHNNYKWKTTIWRIE